MGIFTRFRDIVSANLNAMLDKAEDPEKLIKLMIREMEDTLVEIKASCAGSIASRTRVEREVEEVQAKYDRWTDRAEMAMAKEREDLAREALLEKRQAKERLESLEQQRENLNGVVNQYREDIGELEGKLAQARKKYHVLVQRHEQAKQKAKAQTEIKRVNDTDAFVKFERFEGRIDRMDADADLINVRKPDLDDEFTQIETDEEIERELAALRERRQNQGHSE
jgi:phage shock protein A